MMVKAKGNWVPSRKDPKKKIYFLNVEGEMMMRFRTTFMYVDGKVKLVKTCGMFINSQDITAIRTAGETILKAAKQ